MKERRGVGRLAGLAEGVAASARRRQRDRAPRVLLYDDEGHPRVLSTEDPAYADAVAAAEEMLDLAAAVHPSAREQGEVAPPPSSGGVSVPAAGWENEQEADARGGTRDQG